MSHSPPIREVHKLIDREIVAIVAGIFDFTGVKSLTKDPTQPSLFNTATSIHQKSIVAGVSFDDFRIWFNKVGHQRIPWIELLCLKGWPCSTSPPTQCVSKSSTESVHSKKVDEKIHVVQNGSRNVLKVSVHTATTVVDVNFSASDIGRLTSLLKNTDSSLFEVREHKVSITILLFFSTPTIT